MSTCYNIQISHEELEKVERWHFFKISVHFQVFLGQTANASAPRNLLMSPVGKVIFKYTRVVFSKQVIQQICYWIDRKTSRTSWGPTVIHGILLKVFSSKMYQLTNLEFHGLSFFLSCLHFLLFSPVGKIWIFWPHIYSSLPPHMSPSMKNQHQPDTLTKVS